MKLEFSATAQDGALLRAQQYGFSWMEFVLAIPQPLVCVTTYKASGMTNATMQSWCAFTGEGERLHAIFASVYRHGHLYQTLHERRCCVINIPAAQHFMRCMATVEHNGAEEDELAAARLSAQRATCIDAPLIQECPVNIECTYLWEHELFPGAEHVALCVQAVNLHIDAATCNEQERGRYGPTGYLYNIHAPYDPATATSAATQVGIIQPLATYDKLPQ